MKRAPTAAVRAIFEEDLGVPAESWGAPERISGRRITELLWPLFDLLENAGRTVHRLPYRKRAEGEADRAVWAAATTGDLDRLSKASLSARRVIIDRLTQVVAEVEAQEALGMSGIFFTVPTGLSASARQRVALLRILYRLRPPSAPGAASPATPPESQTEH